MNEEPKIKYTSKDFVKEKSYTLNKTLLAKAVGVLIKVLLRCLSTESTQWTARIVTVVDIRDGKVANQVATISVATNPILEDQTTILDPNEMSVKDSDVFKSMQLKGGAF